MDVDVEGFWYPTVDYGKCIRCGMCMAVCPMIEMGTKNELGKPAPKAYAARSVDPQIKLQSSSGGLFTLLAETVIDSGGAVFGARFDRRLDVIHDYVEDKMELRELKGSKYVQSRIGDAFRQAQVLLERGQAVMFSGTACQIAGLRGYLGREYDHLICQDLICHGVPSPKVWQRYIHYREMCAGSAVRSASFRRKVGSWKAYSVSFVFEDDTEYVRTLHEDLYMRAFLANLCLRPSCHACRFKDMYRESDITLGDFWGVEHLVPAMDDDMGTSLVVVHTQKGNELFSKLRKKAEVYPVSLEEAITFNCAMTSSVKAHPSRAEFFLCLDHTPLDVLIRRYCRGTLDVRLRKRLILGIRHVLEELGLMGKVKRILSRR